jgi:hypothetical protein
MKTIKKAQTTDLFGVCVVRLAVTSVRHEITGKTLKTVAVADWQPEE